jgi:hypothetical protein
MAAGRAVFLFVLAPIAAAVIVTVLLLFGVHPQVVFASGRAIKSFLDGHGFHVAKSVAVASTVALWWAVIAAVGLMWDRRRE